MTPVVSDFDTFLVGSRGMRYEATPPEQLELIDWALDQTTALLASPSTKGWMGRWLDILKEAAHNGFHPTKGPEFGFGDPTSYRLIGDIVNATSHCGAVRHGAECFNFGFPQELDREFLVRRDRRASDQRRVVDVPASVRGCRATRCRTAAIFVAVVAAIAIAVAIAVAVVQRLGASRLWCNEHAA